MKKLLMSFALVSALFVSCGNEKVSKKDANIIKIGVPQPLTGDYAQYGTAIKEGIQLRIDEINEQGGINGKKIVAEYVDTKGDIQEAVNIFKKMASEGVDAVLGEATSGTTLAIAELAQKAKIPMISPAGTAYEITKDKDYIFRTTFIDPYQGEVVAKYLAKEGIKDVALLTNNSSDYSVGTAKQFLEIAKELGINVLEEKYTSNDTDFKSILTKVKNSNVKNVFIPDYYNTIGLILSQAQEVGLDVNYYGTDGWDGVQKDFAKLAEGAIYTSQFTPEDTNEKIQEFIAKYKAKFSKEPILFAALGYDTVLILEEAIKKGTDLKDAIFATDLDLLTGHVKFDENRNPKKAVKLIEIKEGKQTIKETFGE